MEVGPPTHDDYLGIAGVAQVRCQLPLSRPVPAHVEEYLDDDEYYDDSDGGGGQKRGEVQDAPSSTLHQPDLPAYTS